MENETGFNKETMEAVRKVKKRIINDFRNDYKQICDEEARAGNGNVTEKDVEQAIRNVERKKLSYMPNMNALIIMWSGMQSLVFRELDKKQNVINTDTKDMTRQ